ncbi:enoyl-CoA hydratase/isomerase family protein [Photobacterium sanguinicancri]|uniref:enoyl-CoA hydratase/isomerase family protein n=1 Tax=Photobacterium sanguinicancri TaxID=875932 RepID=UPI00247FD8E4|nr:enoyl-CoA hydratase/isomerase family protein [Photobacterium sanguinicancri]
MAGTVNFQLLASKSGHLVGVAELDNQASLNALSFEMIELLYHQLLQWQHDDMVSCVVLCGAGDKAFCAGGDVRAMYHAMSEGASQSDAQKHQSEDQAEHQDNPHTQASEFLTRYFTLEYQCDYLIHTYSKPIIAWGDGIVMGGGIGLYVGASHRVLTERSKLAMPEITIGLYPDVGGTWFLNQLPQGIGLFLGLTGAVINASDALALDIAEHIIPVDHKDQLLDELIQLPWQASDNPYLLVDQALVNLSVTTHTDPLLPSKQLVPYFDQIQAACMGDDLHEISSNIHALIANDKWMERAKATMAAGSPISAHICFRQVTQYAHLDLADCFRLELSLSVRCGELGEFQEGVRARLIDKTGDPKWLFPTVEQVEVSVIDTLFTSLWPEESHPLAGLTGNSF